MADLNLPENPFETIPPEEENEIKELVDLTVKLLAKRYTAPNPSLRGVHPKSHGCVQATFEILAAIFSRGYSPKPAESSMPGFATRMQPPW